MLGYMRLGKVALSGVMVGGLAVILIVGNRPPLSLVANEGMMRDSETEISSADGSALVEMDGMAPPPRPLVLEPPAHHEIAAVSYDDPVEDIDAPCLAEHSPAPIGSHETSDHQEGTANRSSGYDPKSAFPTDETSAAPAATAIATPATPRVLPWPTPPAARPVPIPTPPVARSELPSPPSTASTSNPPSDLALRMLAAAMSDEPNHLAAGYAATGSDGPAMVPERSDTDDISQGTATNSITEPAVSTQQCVVRDPQTQQPVLTLTIPSDVRSSAMDPRALAARRAAAQLDRSERREAARAKVVSAPGEADPLATELLVRRIPELGIVEVAASNVELNKALTRLAEFTDRPIYASPSVRGTLTARFQSTDLVHSLQKLLEPFGFVVIRGDDRIVVRSIGEDFSGDRDRPLIANIESRSERATVDYPQTPYPAAQPPQRLPRTESIDDVAVHGRPRAHQRSALPDTAGLPSQATLPGVRLASAEKVLPPQGGTFDALPAGPTSEQAEDSAAVIRIAQMAQDAFAAYEEEYGLAILQEGIARYPASVLLRRLLGEGHLVRHELEAAEEVLKSALAIDKRNGKLNELLGTTLIERGQKERGSHYLLQAKSYSAGLK